MAIEVLLSWKPEFKPNVITFLMLTLLIGCISWDVFLLPPGLKIKPRVKEKKILLTKPTGKRKEKD